jgi:hypothetical protein
VIVQYDELEPTDRLESVAPDPFEAGQLTWAEADASMLEPHGSIVDITAEERGQQLLFLLGVSAGIASSLAPLMLRALYRRSALWRER